MWITGDNGTGWGQWMAVLGEERRKEKLEKLGVWGTEREMLMHLGQKHRGLKSWFLSRIGKGKAVLKEAVGLIASLELSAKGTRGYC